MSGLYRNNLSHGLISKSKRTHREPYSLKKTENNKKAENNKNLIIVKLSNCKSAGTEYPP